MENVVIDSIAVSGDGVGRLPDGKVVFVAGALPGDSVRLKLTETRKRVQYAELLEITTPSPERVPSLCGNERCGGCALKSASSKLHSRLKRQQIVETLRRIGDIDASNMLGQVFQFGDGWHYRHRVRLHATYSNKAWQLGYFERRSRTLMPLSACPVLWPELEKLAHSLAKSVARLPQSAGLSEIEMAYSRCDERGAAKITSTGTMAAYRQSLAWFEDSGLSGVEIETADARFRHGNLELRYDHKRARDFDIRFEPGLFTQAYPAANDRLVDGVMNAVRPRENLRVLELHSGVGNFTLPLARAGARIDAYEQNRRAVILCQRSAQAPGMQIQLHPEPDTAALARLSEFDLLLLDPPRTGARAVAEALVANPKGPSRVVYVSCDVATLARDAMILVGGGFRVTNVEGYDMFPQTPHIETLLVLERG